MNHTFCFFFFSISLTAQPVEVSLWTDEFPQPYKIEDKADAKIFIHHSANPNGTAAIICPGGGYRGQVMGAEGHGIAEWLGMYGITGIVLKYRPTGRSLFRSSRGCPAGSQTGL